MHTYIHTYLPTYVRTYLRTLYACMYACMYGGFQKSRVPFLGVPITWIVGGQFWGPRFMVHKPDISEMADSLAHVLIMVARLTHVFVRVFGKVA